LTMVAIIFFLLATFFFYYLNLPFDLNLLILKNDATLPLGFFALILIFLAGLAVSGTPPFHFAHIDCTDGSNISVAFLLLSNSFIQGGVLLYQIKTVLAKSGLDNTKATYLAGMLLIGFMVLWLRALDQSKIRRTIAYIAASVGPLFSLSMLFGVSVLLPKLIFLLATFSFLSLTLFSLCGSLAYMGPINTSFQTWEDMSGFGRQNPWQTLTLLMAIAAITGLPGTLGYFIKLSLIAPFHESYLLSGSIFLSIAIGAACTMRFFVFAFSKMGFKEGTRQERPHLSIVIASLILIALGFFPFVR